MHAHNPVDWYPWGAEAFARARAEKKPIFLSIGYSSCYWCHVMERESFMDEEIADFMNRHFVCIKVDREERPDVDQIYMTALQLYYQLAGVGRGGGWPMSMFLLPDGKPFLGGSYFPPRDGPRGTGFLTVLRRVSEVWKNEPQRVEQQAARLTEVVVGSLNEQHPAADKLPGDKVIRAITQALAENYDRRYGGFGYSEANPHQPKFPEPSNLLFLLDRVRRSGDPEARRMLEGTLSKMAAGGIRDHIGGGFHRYSTDRFWRVPHFEKMLYDNGQLASVYAKAFALNHDPSARRVVDELVAFVLRELTSPEGGFYSSLDAETDGREGVFYVWDKAELKRILTPDEFALAARVYGLDAEPNFEGHYILLLPRPLAETAAALKIEEAALVERLEPIRQKLLKVRAKRARPRTDVKILTGWNGLMIRGLADAGRIFEQPRYVDAARRAADFVWQHLRSDQGRLWRTYAGGQAKLNAYLDDYAFLTDGLLALGEATGERRWTQRADQLMRKQIELFWDDARGGFFFTSEDHETLLARGKDPVDSAIPSGNAVSAHNLVRLSILLDRPAYRRRAKKTLLAFAWIFNRSPLAAPRMAVALAALKDLEKPASARPPVGATKVKP